MIITVKDDKLLTAAQRIELFDMLPRVVREAVAASAGTWNTIELHWLLQQGWTPDAMADAVMVNDRPDLTPWGDDPITPTALVGLLPLRSD